MTYTVKEIFYTLQGEGAQSGRAAVFCRFSGCNLWSGREEDRHSAVCQFCDTDFVGTGPDGGKFADAKSLAERIDACWHGRAVAEERKYVVCTGGEPLLQLDELLITELHDRGFEVAVETNGTGVAPDSLDWICVSPKAGAPLVQRRGDELKLVFPQPGASPETFESLDFDHFFLQPMDGPQLQRNVAEATQYCMSNPRWRLSLQTHKLLGIR
jgi:7-carboxy-7-deazaguanine synthase (Cx14CxxC type)